MPDMPIAAVSPTLDTAVDLKPVVHAGIKNHIGKTKIKKKKKEMRYERH